MENDWDMVTYGGLVLMLDNGVYTIEKGSDNRDFFVSVRLTPDSPDEHMLVDGCANAVYDALENPSRL